MPAGPPTCRHFLILKMNDPELELRQIQSEISVYIPYEDFVRIENRLEELKKEEDAKLQALSDLQQAYVSANSDFEKNYVKEMVGQIREMSRTARAEIRALNQEIVAHNLTLERARELYQKIKTLGRNL